MSSPMPPQYPGAPVQKKTSPWVWILAGVGAFFVLIMGTCFVGSFLLVRAVKNAGYDPALMQRNPGLAMAKMITAMNPNLEKISSDEKTGTITVRDKTDGKVVTFRFDPDKKQMVVIGDDGKQVSVSTSGGDGKDSGVTIQSSEGTVKFGAAAGNNAPAWVPVYPGSTAQGTMSSQNADGMQNTFGFKSKDSASKVLAYYQDQFKTSGFNVTLSSSTDQGGMLSAEDADKKRSVIVVVGSSAEGAEGTVTATEKK